MDFLTNSKGLKLTWRVAWRRIGGKLMGIRQFYGSRVYADPSLALVPKVGFTQLSSSGASKRRFLYGVLWINQGRDRHNNATIALNTASLGR